VDWVGTPMTGSSEHGNEHHDSKNGEKFLE
jgi:hypothetical protein